MSFGIFAIKYGPTRQQINRWLKSFAPHANNGMGLVQFTGVMEQAQRFDSEVAALRYMTTASDSARPDGTPNRPMRAFDCEIRRLPDA